MSKNNQQKTPLRIFAGIIVSLLLLLIFMYFLLTHLWRGRYLDFLNWLNTNNVELENEGAWIVIFLSIILLFFVFLGGFFIRNSGFVEYTDQHNQRRVRTLWDWVKLLIIPLVLTGGGFLYTAHQNYMDTQSRQDQQDFTIMKEYLDDMSKFIDEHKQLGAEQQSPAESTQTQLLFATVAARTTAVINNLQSPEKKKEVIQFLVTTTLIQSPPNQVPAPSNKVSVLSTMPLLILRGVDLDRVDLNGMNLGSIYLNYSNLDNINLKGALLTDAIISASDLEDADLEDAQMRGSVLINSKLLSAHLDHAQMQDSNLKGADLKHAILTGASLNKANLTNVNLRHAILTDVDLSDADLTNADLKDADITGVNLTGACFYHTRMPDHSYVNSPCMKNKKKR